MAGEYVEKFETEFVTSGASKIIVEGGISCKFVEDKPVSMRCIFRDITHRKEIERMKNEFIATVSHELRTPLTAIHGSLGAIAGGIGGEVPPRVKTLTELARKNSARLIRMINDFLDVEKMESGRMEFHIKPVEFMSLIENAIDTTRSFGDKFGVKYVLKEKIPGAMVNSDGDRIVQVVTNLLSNAAKFSRPDTDVNISVTRNDAYLKVEVADRGSGIPEEFRPRIFQKFAQASKGDRAGTGLGLSISKAIIERLGGSIGFESQINKGSTFYFELPELKPV